MKKEKLVIPVAILLVVAFAAGRYAFNTEKAEALAFAASENFEAFVRPHARIYGPEDAKVVLIEFTDPACETCAAFHPFTRHLMDQHPGKVKTVVRYAPFHGGSDQVVRALEAASRQADYWQVLELVLQTQAQWTQNHQVLIDRLLPILAQAGLDMERLQADMNDGAITQLIGQDLADAEALGVTKTPGFFVNGKPLVTFGYEPLQQLVEAEVRAQYPAN